VVGVADRSFQENVAEALLGLGTEHSLVVSADDGLDEISISGSTRIIEVRDGHSTELFVSPGDLGLAEADLADVAGGDPDQNAAIARAVLSGESGSARDLVLANAAAAIYVAGRAASIAEGVGLAADSIDSGEAARTLERLADSAPER
jgi:anthranilate phosphoribosyltransferase